MDKVAGMSSFHLEGTVSDVMWTDAFVEEAKTQLSIEPHRIPIIILAAILTYGAFLILVKLFGSRVLSSMSASDAVIIIMFGAVAGRAILGHPPTVAAGIIGLLTLMALEAFFGILRDKSGIRRFIDRDPVLLIFEGVPVTNGIRQSHFSREDIRMSLRKAGIWKL